MVKGRGAPPGAFLGFDKHWNRNLEISASFALLNLVDGQAHELVAPQAAAEEQSQNARSRPCSAAKTTVFGTVACFTVPVHECNTLSE